MLGLKPLCPCSLCGRAGAGAVWAGYNIHQGDAGHNWVLPQGRAGQVGHPRPEGPAPRVESASLPPCDSPLSPCNLKLPQPPLLLLCPAAHPWDDEDVPATRQPEGQCVSSTGHPPHLSPSCKRAAPCGEPPAYRPPPAPPGRPDSSRQQPGLEALQLEPRQSGVWTTGPALWTGSPHLPLRAPCQISATTSTARTSCPPWPWTRGQT